MKENSWTENIFQYNLKRVNKLLFKCIYQQQEAQKYK